MNSDYLVPGVAALATAVIYPVYWILETGAMLQSGELRTGLGGMDILFLLLVGLVPLLYVSLRRLLNTQCAYHGTDALLTIMAIFSGVSYGLLWVLGYAGAGESLLGVSWMLASIAFGVLDLLLGIWLVRAGEEVPASVKTFAAVTIVLGAVEVSVLLAGVSVVIFPISLVALAVVFLRQPEELQIV